MEKAIEQAKQMGVGMVVANMTNHFSIAGHWALMAEKEGLIGMAFTNTSPKVPRCILRLNSGKFYYFHFEA